MRSTILSSVICSGYIPALSMCGPIINPLLIPENIVCEMVKGGYEMYEHNPVNYTEKIRLTIHNMKDEKKFVPGEDKTPAVNIGAEVETMVVSVDPVAEAAKAAEAKAVEEAVQAEATPEPEVEQEVEDVDGETDVAAEATESDTKKLSKNQRKKLAQAAKEK